MLSADARSGFLEGLGGAAAMQYAVASRLLMDVPACLKEHDEVVVRRYLLLYTFPLLEMCGLFRSADYADQLFWALLQTQVGVHLRYLDDLIDGDVSPESVATRFQATHRLLRDVRHALNERGLAWSARQDDIYGQLFEFEAENRAGFNHDFDSMWRRVSPLCVVADTYLLNSTDESLLLAYREYLAWSLLQADCDDGLKDFGKLVRTPVTRVIRTVTSRTHLDWNAGAGAIAEVKEFLDHRREVLLAKILPCPLWSIIVRHLDQAFSHEEVST